MKFAYPFSSSTLGQVRRALLDEGFFNKPISPDGFYGLAFIERSQSENLAAIFIPELEGRLCICVKGEQTIRMTFEAQDGFRHEADFHFFCCNDINFTRIVARFLSGANKARSHCLIKA